MKCLPSSVRVAVVASPATSDPTCGSVIARTTFFSPRRIWGRRNKYVDAILAEEEEELSFIYFFAVSKCLFFIKQLQDSILARGFPLFNRGTRWNLGF
jgi:hypothetical protein